MISIAHRGYRPINTRTHAHIHVGQQHVHALQYMQWTYTKSQPHVYAWRYHMLKSYFYTGYYSVDKHHKCLAMHVLHVRAWTRPTWRPLLIFKILLDSITFRPPIVFTTPTKCALYIAHKMKPGAPLTRTPWNIPICAKLYYSHPNSLKSPPTWPSTPPT